MNCVILQPSYIPWRGYFHQIQKADLFIFFDDVQYDKRGWRNRNRIKTANGTIWLTIPVHSKGAQTKNIAINEISILNDLPWAKDHWRTIQAAYAKAPFFKQFAPRLESFYQSPPASLADFTIDFTIALAKELGIHHTRFMRSSEIKSSGAKTDRLISLLKEVHATHYISGPSAREYIEVEKFKEANISLEYIKYEYPPYPQLYPPFDPQVSILDLLFMTGSDALKYISA